MIKTTKGASVDKSNCLNKNAPLFTCDICKMNFNYKYVLIQHLKTHDSNFKIRQESYQCKICDVAYCEYRLLLKHIRNTHFNFDGKVSFYRDKMVNETWVERVNQSNVCVQMTKLTDNVIAIKRCSQTCGDIIEANVTEDKATDQTTLIKSATSFSKVLCNYCSKEMLKKNLQKHINKFHFNTKPFRCESCGNYFTKRFHLTKHLCARNK